MHTPYFIYGSPYAWIDPQVLNPRLLLEVREQNSNGGAGPWLQNL